MTSKLSLAIVESKNKFSIKIVGTKNKTHFTNIHIWSCAELVIVVVKNMQ